LKKQANGTISAVDYLDIRLGELKSTVFRHIFLPFASKESGASFSNPTLDAFAKNWSSVQEIQQARQAKDFQKALQLYKQLPPELQKERICLNEAIGASQKISPEEYFSVLETFKSAFPNDPFVDLTLTDYYILQKDYDKCIECILRLDKYLGGDAVQNNHAATIYFNQEKYDEARKMAEKAIELENDFLPAYENLLLISFKEKNFDKSVNLLEILNEKFKMNIHELPPNSSNEDFLKSPQYQEWLKKQNSTGDSPKPE
jgi:tetratricopeptide (TPR) repeat protein